MDQAPVYVQEHEGQVDEPIDGQDNDDVAPYPSDFWSELRYWESQNEPVEDENPEFGPMGAEEVIEHAVPQAIQPGDGQDIEMADNNNVPDQMDQLEA